MTAKITMSDRDPALRKLIGLAGGIQPLAKRLGVAQSTIHGWKHIPLKHVIPAEREFPGEISRHEMAPEFFGDAA